ncbi:unnamed protein product [Clonostachys rhizophaga]|uniref:Uncharacterized protein n=1 Tax=Clonostachys rhizophaga TaxID=160324 RepID=A0A9N9YEZ8_9HYPO|nr:unnamed protein product [Clonostachys rhizophaga]
MMRAIEYHDKDCTGRASVAAYQASIMQAGARHSNILAMVTSYGSTLCSQLIASLRLGLYLHGPGDRVGHNARTENTMGRTRRDMTEADSIRGGTPSPQANPLFYTSLEPAHDSLNPSSHRATSVYQPIDTPKHGGPAANDEYLAGDDWSPATLILPDDIGFALWAQISTMAALTLLGNSVIANPSASNGLALA